MDKHPHQTIFCDNIRILRLTHSLSRTAMAKQLGISLKTLDTIESGILPPGTSIQLFFRVQERFHIPMERLFEPFV